MILKKLVKSNYSYENLKKNPHEIKIFLWYKQWRQTLIYIGGALNNKFHSLWIIGGAKSNFI